MTIPHPDPTTQPASSCTATDGTTRRGGTLVLAACNDAEPGPAHCPTCTCHTFDVRTSRIVDLVVTLHETLGTATEQVGTVRVLLEAEVWP